MQTKKTCGQAPAGNSAVTFFKSNVQRLVCGCLLKLYTNVVCLYYKSAKKPPH